MKIGSELGTNSTSAAGHAQSARSFADVLKTAVDQTVGNLQSAETLEQDAAKGVASIDELATTIAKAETMLETLVVLRDKLINSYNEIIRTPI